jgi:hypothetical protein
MKAMIIIFTLMAISIKAPSALELTIEATYVSSEEGIYTFVDEDEKEYEFSDIDAEAYKKFNLDSNEFVGKRFKITYELDTEIDENDEEYAIYIIIDLDLID